MDVHYPDATLGAVATGIDLRHVSATDLEAILALWHQRAVVVFAGQHLSDAEQIAFSAHFGRFERGLRQASTSKLAVLSNVTADGQVAAPSSLQVRFHIGNTHWHSDSSYKRVGAKASILAARVVPDTGGETEWADMRAAWEALDADMQRHLENRVAIHSYVFSHSWHGGLEIIGSDDVQRLSPVRHPIMRVHPQTGRRSLFVGRHASHIEGDDETESRKLLAQLTAAACQPPRTWKHRWQVGDIGIWDNRCVLHRGHLWPETQARTMVRTTIAGDDIDNEWAMVG